MCHLLALHFCYGRPTYYRLRSVVLTGSLSGRVTDSSGAAVPGASVVMQNLATGVQQTAATKHEGLYQFPVNKLRRWSVTQSDLLSRPQHRSGQLWNLTGNQSKRSSPRVAVFRALYVLSWSTEDLSL